MRKTLLIALVALGAAFQGEVYAENSIVQVENHQLIQTQNNDLIVEWVLNQVVDLTGMTYNEVRSLYDAGNLTIEEISEGYEVTIYSVADGGLTDILIATGF